MLIDGGGGGSVNRVGRTVRAPAPVTIRPLEVRKTTTAPATSRPTMPSPAPVVASPVVPSVSPLVTSVTPNRTAVEPPAYVPTFFLPQTPPPVPTAPPKPSPITASLISPQTEQAITDLSAAEKSLADVQAAGSGVPGSVLQAMSEGTQEARDRVATSLASDMREVAQNTPPTAGADIYADFESQLNARDVPASVPAETWNGIVDQSLAEAAGEPTAGPGASGASTSGTPSAGTGATDPAGADPATNGATSAANANAGQAQNLNEATWRRQHQEFVYEAAADAHADAVNRAIESGGITSPVADPDGTLAASRDALAAQREALTNAYEVEIGFVAEQAGGQPDAAIDAWRTQLATDLATSPQSEVMLAAADEAVTTIKTYGADGALLQDAVEARVEADAARVNTALQQDGAEAAISTLNTVKSELITNPVTVNGTAFDDPATIALLQSQLDAELGDTIDDISTGLADQINAIDVGAGDTDAQIAAAAEVTRLGRLGAESLPGDRVADFVTETEPALNAASTRILLGVREGDLLFGVDTEAVGKPINDVVAIAEVLADSPGGESLIDSLAEPFVDHYLKAGIGPDSVLMSMVGQPIDGASDAPTLGLNLAVSVRNGLVDKTGDSNHSAVYNLDQAMRVVVDDLASGSEDRLNDFVENREELAAYVAAFPGLSDPGLPVAGAADQSAARNAELQAAVADYLERHPEVAETDAELLQALNEDAVRMTKVEAALGSLDDTEARDDIIAPLNDYLLSDKSGQQPIDFYMSAPGLQTEFTTNFAEVAASAEYQAAREAAGGDLSLLQFLAEHPNEQSFARNARFTWLEGRYVMGAGDLPTGGAIANKFTGFGLMTAAAATNTGQMLGLDAPNANGFLTALDAAEVVNFSYLSSRDAAQFAHLLTGKQALQNYALKTGSVDNSFELVAKTFGDGAAANAFRLNLASRGLFVVTDSVTLGMDIAGGANGITLTGDSLALVGSGAMVAQMVGLWSGATWAGPVGWIGAGLWTVGAGLRYIGSRTAEANRFETDDQRRFLSFYGAMDADGNPVITGSQVQVSDANGDNVRMIDVVDLANLDDDAIVYRGLSAEAVNNLMNYSGDADHPRSPIPVLDQLAIANGLTTREFYLNYFSKLTGDQQKTLVEACHGIEDLTAEGISDESLAYAIPADNYFQRLSDMQAYGQITQEQWELLLDAEGQSPTTLYEYAEDGLGGGMTVFDTDRLREVLGLNVDEPLPSDQSPELVNLYRMVIASRTFGDEGGGFRPDSVASLEFWMDLHEYPAFPSPAALQDTTPRTPVALPVETPAGEPPAVAPPDASVDVYTVVPGDTLWDIAQAHGVSVDALADLDELVAFHNANNPAGEADIAIPSQTGEDRWIGTDEDGLRSPHLIYPGNEIYLEPQVNAADRPRG